MTRLPLLVALFLGVVACNDESSDSSNTDDLDTDTSDMDSDTTTLGEDRRDTHGTCSPPSDACEETTFREVFRAADFFVYSGPPLGPHSEQIDNVVDFQTWWQRTESPDDMPIVDFANEVVLISGYSINASCGVSLESVDVSTCGGTTRLTTTSLDTTGTCFETCDAEGGTMVAVVVPRGSTEVCAQVDLTCR